MQTYSENFIAGRIYTASFYTHAKQGFGTIAIVLTCI